MSTLRFTQARCVFVMLSMVLLIKSCGSWPHNVTSDYLEFVRVADIIVDLLFVCCIVFV